MSRFSGPGSFFSIWRTARLPLRLEAKRKAGLLENVQRVRFQKRAWRWKPAVGKLVAVYVAFNFYDFYVFGPLLDAAEGVELPDEEDAEAKRFIPFPFTIKETQPAPYRGSDPEWQEYMKFSKDLDKGKRIRKELADLVCAVISKHPEMVAHCGKNQKVRRYWLDVDFPALPPPEFERTGLLLTEESMSIATMPVDSKVREQIRNALWPASMAQSVWSFTTVLIKGDLKKFASYLGIQIETPITPMEQMLDQHVKLIAQTAAKKDPKDGLPPSLPGQSQSPNEEKAPILADATSKERPALTYLFKDHFTRAYLAFRIKLAQTWKPAMSLPPRGSIQVSGFIELETPTTWTVWDVRAFWDPKTRSYHHPSMIVAQRRLQPRKQGPMGGNPVASAAYPPGEPPRAGGA